MSDTPISQLETLIAALIGFALLFSLYHSVRRLSHNKTHTMGFAMSSIAFAVVLGMAFVAPLQIFTLSETYLQFVTDMTGQRMPQRSPFRLRFLNREAWWLVSALLLFLTLLIMLIMKRRSRWQKAMPFPMLVLLGGAALSVASFVALKYFEKNFINVALSWNYYWPVLVHMISATFFILAVVLFYYFLSPVLGVVSVGALLQYFGTPMANAVDFSFVFDVLKQIGVEHLTWQLTLLFATAIFSIHEIILSPFKIFSSNG